MKALRPRFLRHPATAIAVAGLSFALSACGARATAEESIVASFEDFIEAVAEADGGDAADEVSTTTLELFQEVVDRAVDDDAASLRRASPAVRLAVYAARETYSESKLERMDGEELFAAMVGEGWVSPYTDQEVAFEILALTEDSGTIAVGHPQDPRRPQLRYVLESGRWRLDLAASRKDADRIAGDIFRYGGGSELDTVKMILGR